jgi:hypothetical protein
LTYTRDAWLLERVSYVDGEIAARVRYDDAPTGRLVSSSTPTGMGYGIRVTRLQPHDPLAAPFVAADDGTYRFVIDRVFDTAGRLIGERVFAGTDLKTAAAPLARFVYRYDDKSRMTERSRFYGTLTEPFEKETYAYDEHDHVVQTVHYRQNNSMASRRTFVYEYDEHGNWIKRTETEMLGNTPDVTVTTRVITYY